MPGQRWRLSAGVFCIVCTQPSLEHNILNKCISRVGVAESCLVAASPVVCLNAVVVIVQDMGETSIDEDTPKYLAKGIALFEATDDELLPIRPIGIQVTGTNACCKSNACCRTV